MPGAVATGWLALRALQRGTTTDALLALVVVPTLRIARGMLGYAGWYDGHDGYTTAMFYTLWQLNLLLGPGYYLYFRSLTSQEFRLLPRAWVHLLPGLLQLGLVAGVLGYDLLRRQGIRGQPLPYWLGTQGPALVALEAHARLLAYLQ